MISNAAHDMPVNYYAAGVRIGRDVPVGAVPDIGQGVRYGGVFYRVDDVWFNYDEHAPLDHGVAVFLEETGAPSAFRAIDGEFYPRDKIASPPPAAGIVPRTSDEPNLNEVGF